MGLILKDKSLRIIRRLAQNSSGEDRYPGNIYGSDVYYNLYLMAVRDGDTAQAEKWRRKILTDFPESPYGQAMRDPNYFDNLRRMNLIQEEMYEKSISGISLRQQPSGIYDLTSEMEKDYPLSKILPKFVFIDALSYLTENDNDKFRERLTTLLERWLRHRHDSYGGQHHERAEGGTCAESGTFQLGGMI